MNTTTQAQANRRQVVVTQLQDEVNKLAAEWQALSRKSKIEAWLNWLEAAPAMRVFLPYHRVLSVMEGVS
ncbi:hypothetical protein [Brevundimonas sp.]|uniref:hypothetical protein n=1 Tax=Brevundimonas sp. TaxID=1871086 RepID=UPI0027F1860C|nr:hypothetical protein [Brevundimonas sp.]MDQ7814098.1 hypothetical protein [Brevundimonas sp.]